MQRAGLVSTARLQGTVILHRPCIELAQVFEQARHGQTRFKPVRH
jgi:hypothetical protein